MNLHGSRICFILPMISSTLSSNKISKQFGKSRISRGLMKFAYLLMSRQKLRTVKNETKFVWNRTQVDCTGA